ncbi:prepilin-type N-terminal cleavage/methylation domain-containing protein [Pseudenhygromyxa sp. WMMC2535]|uniref:PilW family protein n=1 Tax=Pseudenhygromyxa sp. WMMC2535 TaxID=2712867 RepID=UPI001595B155|nr:prepilin-type N-terminal cleavage/methylation domain-containing protein [Pseudenhygromyxa sp. WMMC2535]NVB40539.1 prepilin-type N-terminal cleavage/methylation domain-containing protein [Pseudenhygromyxa sp. WMMC2535]
MSISQKTLAKLRRSAGFTLIELMVAILVSSIVLMGVFAFATIQKDTANMHHRQVLVQQALEGAMHSIGTDLRMAGLGFGRTCSEIRIWSNSEGKLINPGAMRGDDLGNVYVDGVTNEPYWVLRDGVQAHWRSSPDDGANSLAGDANTTSAATSSAADSFDVFRGELNMVPGSGLFEVSTLPSASGVNAVIEFESSTLLDNSNGTQKSAVRQMFAPGSFVLVVPVLDNKKPYYPTNQSQCALIQVTGEVDAGGSVTNWSLPIGNTSQFNMNLEVLLGLNNTVVPDDASGAGVDGGDWFDPAGVPRLELVPLGRARWSRYEIDYTVPSRPMLVRSDIIGWREGDPSAGGNVETYPGCTGASCRMPTLYLPSGVVQPPRVAIGPMIEDMQVAVGCDGWSSLAIPVADGEVPAPDVGFEEKGPGDGPLANQANRKVDERDAVDDRGNDEWIGNATQENWAPDCVSWGTAQRNAAEWAGAGPASEAKTAPGFRMSPQVIRVTLVAKPDTLAGGADVATDALYNELVAIEDRPTMDAVILNREYRTLTERFQVRNARWRPQDLR